MDPVPCYRNPPPLRVNSHDDWAMNCWCARFLLPPTVVILMGMDATPQCRRFQFTLRTLLLLFVVLGSSMAVFGAWGIAVFVVAVGLAIYIQRAESLPSPIQLILLLVCLLGLVAMLLPAVQSARGSRPGSACRSNLKQIALAILNYQAAYGCFPPAYIVDKNGKPMHSWRVLILPFLEEDQLYKAYNFNKPWNGPNNKKLLALRPRVYACPSDPSVSPSGSKQTNYVAVVGANAALAGEKSRKIGWTDLAGGLSKTVMLVEVASSDVAWTEPRDLSLDAIGTSEGKSSSLPVSSRHSRDESCFVNNRPQNGPPAPR